MSIEAANTEHLFSYGTLQSESVQLATFNRKLEGKPDVLPGYVLTKIEITDPEVVAKTGDTHYRNIRYTGVSTDLIHGTVFKVSKTELEQADAYEEDAYYKRVQVELRSGTNAWVYFYKP